MGTSLRERHSAKARTRRRRDTADHNMNRAEGMAKAKSGRAGLACDECRMRKRRCDGGHPVCGGCLKRTTVCIYPTDKNAKAKSNGHVRLIRMLRSRLQELENEQPTLESHDEQLAADMRQSIPSPQSGPRTESRIATVDEDLRMSQTPRSPARRPTFLRQPSESTVYHDDHEPQQGRNSQTLASNRAPSGDQSYGVECLMKPIDQAIDDIDQQLNERQDDLNMSQQVRNELYGVPKLCECDRIVRAVRWSLPTRRHADSLVECHFLRFNRMYPILHEQTFMRQYGELWRTGAYSHASQAVECCGLCAQKSGGKVFQAMVYMIFASGSLFESNMLERNIARGNTYYSMAQQSIDLFDILDHQLSIEFVQLGLLLGYYLQSTERFSKCWNIAGLTIRMAQNMGLHLAPHDAQRRGYDVQMLTQLESEMRCRVWHGCVMLDREVSMLFGRPLMLPGTYGGGIDLPCSIDDRELSDRPGDPSTQPEDRPSYMEAYVRLIKLYDILEEVLMHQQSHYTRSTPLISKPDTSARSLTPPVITSLLDLDSRIIEWREALPSFLQCDPGSITHDSPESRSPETLYTFVGQAQRLCLRFLHVRILILRPALEILFVRQTGSQKPATLRDSMDVRVQELMLLDIAAQCVRLAETLVDVYSKLGFGSYGAWWYNISHLHTAGSTLLLGRLCSFASNSISADALVASWDICLDRISRYADISTIAKKSYRRLNESAQRLLYVHQEQSRVSHPNEEVLNQNPTCPVNRTLSSHVQVELPPMELGQPQSSVSHQRNSLASIGAGHPFGVNRPVEASNELNDYLPLAATPNFRSQNYTYEDEISANALNLLSGDDLADPNSVANQNLWSFTPYLSQLEGCSPTLGHMTMF